MLFGDAPISPKSENAGIWIFMGAGKFGRLFPSSMTSIRLMLAAFTSGSYQQIETRLDSHTRRRAQPTQWAIACVAEDSDTVRTPITEDLT
jgi:hypothetical protein